MPKSLGKFDHIGQVHKVHTYDDALIRHTHFPFSFLLLIKTVVSSFINFSAGGNSESPEILTMSFGARTPPPSTSTGTEKFLDKIINQMISALNDSK